MRLSILLKLKEVLKGNADLAVTNKTSFNAYKQEGIHFIFHKYNAKIVCADCQPKRPPMPYSAASL